MFFYNRGKSLLGEWIMETMGKVYPINSRAIDLDKSVQKDENLCFFRFIGGNDSETEQLINHLRQLRKNHELVIGIFRFPFRFEGKKRFITASTQYYLIKELCDAVIYFRSDSFMELIDENTTMRDANVLFNSVEEHTIQSLKQIIEKTGDINIDYQDLKTFILKNKRPLFLHTVEEESFDEPLKYLISTPYLPDDFTDGKQLMINIGYTREVNMDMFRQINLRLKIGSYFIDEPGESFKITLIVNGIQDPVEIPNEYKRPFKYHELFKKWYRLAEKGSRRLSIIKK